MSKAQQTPLIDLLAGVPTDARILIVTDGGMSSHSIPVGRLAAEAAAELRRLTEINQGLCTKANGYVIANARLTEEVEALRKQLAEQPAPVLTDEPVAWLTRDAIDGLWYPTAFAKTPNDRPLYARAILSAAIPPGCVVVPVEKLEVLRFIQRVLEGDAPQADRNAAAQMVRDLRKGVAARPGECQHKWVNADNAHVEGADLCMNCGAIRARPGGEG